MQKKLFFILVIIASILLGIDIASADLVIPGSDTIKKASIGSNTFENKQDIKLNDVRGFGGKLLSIARIVISGFALIYIVLIGARMVLFSEEENEIANQKKQLFYSLFAFIFLNVPDITYRLFLNTNRGELRDASWTNMNQNSSFWNSNDGEFGVGKFLSSSIDFLKIAAFVVAIISFAWGAYQLLISRGKDEYKENAQNRVLYGVLGLIFLGIVEAWSFAARQTNLQEEVSKVAGGLFGVALFFAAPVAVFFLILGAYYYITSAGNEEKAKKGKNIFLYTFIATLILLAGVSFLQELIQIWTN